MPGELVPYQSKASDFGTANQRKSGTVTLRSKDPKLRLDGLLGPSPIPQLQGGTGQWEEVNRPKRNNIINWTGQNLFKMSVPIIFDGWKTQRSVEPQIAILLRMARTHIEDVRPPMVKILGPIPGTTIDWVIEGLDWDEELTERHRTKGYRVRQAVVVNLVQLIEPDILTSKRGTLPGSTVGGESNAEFTWYKVKKGDTFPKLAVTFLKNADRWKEIAKLNKLPGPAIPADRIGKLIKIPKK